MEEVNIDQDDTLNVQVKISGVRGKICQVKHKNRVKVSM